LILAAFFLALQWVAGLGMDVRLRAAGLETVADLLTPSLANSATYFIAFLSLVGLGRFATRYLGDVLQWTTYAESNERHEKRRETIKIGIEVLRHVLSDERCSQVIVVGHSLGTAVAHDTLLELTRKNRATNAENPIEGPIPLEKIRAFVTLGSPIDKLHYLFESFRSEHHRYTRVVQSLRGDLGEAPFAKNRKPHIHWINFWDVGDPISGPLQSPSNRRHVHLSVDNVQVSSLRFPDPGRSHSAYFRNRDVMAPLFDLIFLEKYRYQDAPLIPERGYDYAAMHVQAAGVPGAPSRWRVVMFATPWVFAGSAVMRLLGIDGWLLQGAYALSFTALIALSIGWLHSAALGPRHSI